MKDPIKNKIVKFLFDTSFYRLLIIAVTLYLITAIFYAVAYYLTHGIKSDDPSASITFIDYMYFTFVTQTTIGYGDFFPIKYGKIVFIFHSLTSILFFSILIGATVSKIFLPNKHTIFISKIVVFFPEIKAFRFGFFNTEVIPLGNVEFTVRFRTPSSIKSLIMNQYDIKITRTSAPILSHNIVWILDTEPCKPGIEKTDNMHIGTQSNKILSPTDIAERSSLVLQIRGIYYHSQHTSTLNFPNTQIHCGKFKIVQSAPGEINYDNIDKYERVDKETCFKCLFRECCKIQDKHDKEKR